MPTWLLKLDEHFPIRYLAWLACAVAFLLSAFAWVGFHVGGLAALVFAGLTVTGLHDVLQTQRALQCLPGASLIRGGSQ